MSCPRRSCTPPAAERRSMIAARRSGRATRPDAWDGVKTLLPASQPLAGPRSRVAVASPLWDIVEAAQLLARVADQRTDHKLLRPPVGDPGRGRAGPVGEAAVVAQRLPVRCPIARAAAPASIHERLCDQDRMANHRPKVARESANAQPRHPRREVRRGAPGQNSEKGRDTMPKGTLVETIYGKSSKYEVYRYGTWSNKFDVYKDGKYWHTYSALDAAIAAINRDK